jgi:hypothetical protein
MNINHILTHCEDIAYRAAIRNKICSYFHEPSFK